MDDQTNLLARAVAARTQKVGASNIMSLAWLNRLHMHVLRFKHYIYAWQQQVQLSHDLVRFTRGITFLWCPPKHHLKSYHAL